MRRRLILAVSIAALGAGSLATGCAGKPAPATKTTGHGHGHGGYREQEHY